MTQWRAVARKAIDDAIKTAPPDISTKELRKILGAAYPFYEKTYHPYKIWLDEVKKAVARKDGKQLPPTQGGLF